VRDFTARQNLVKMKRGDLAFFQRFNEGKGIVGIAEILKEASTLSSTLAGTPSLCEKWHALPRTL
jgi:predicted RNA-binding protein with PUA-like domain